MGNLDGNTLESTAQTNRVQALELDGGSAAARQGLAQAEALQQQQGAQQQQEAAAARAGSRPGMSRDAVPEAEAAQQLYSAAQMLAANPRLHAARWGLFMPLPLTLTALWHE